MRHLSSNEADGHTRWEADAYLLSLPSYPLLFEKARLIGKMFYVSMVPILALRSQLDCTCREDEETQPEALTTFRDGAHIIHAVVCDSMDDVRDSRTIRTKQHL